MTVAIVTGSAGLIGSDTVRRFAAEGLDVVGIDNDMRSVFFGTEASTRWSRHQLEKVQGYTHHDIDIRATTAINRIFSTYGKDIVVVVHTAAQPSHDWAAREPATDFSVNAAGTLNLLEACRRHSPEAVFIFTSTNKVYGSNPNDLPLVELQTRFEIDNRHPFFSHGIDETLSIDHTLHSLFGVSKSAADLLVQEYGRYFGMKTACFRGGCLTGAGHSGAELHGFLAYLVKCALVGQRYTVFGYKGKQVRDNIHSSDLVAAFWHFLGSPRQAAVYNIGGGRHANCSVLEAIELTQEISGKKLNWSYDQTNRIGDHMWWISDTRRFHNDYPQWGLQYDMYSMITEIVDGQKWRLKMAVSRDRS